MRAATDGTGSDSGSSSSESNDNSSSSGSSGNNSSSDSSSDSSSWSGSKSSAIGNNSSSNSCSVSNSGNSSRSNSGSSRNGRSSSNSSSRGSSNSSSGSSNGQSSHSNSNVSSSNSGSRVSSSNSGTSTGNSDSNSSSSSGHVCSSDATTTFACLHSDCDARLTRDELRTHFGDCHPSHPPPPAAYLAPLNLMACPQCSKIFHTQRGILSHAKAGCGRGQTLAQLHGAAPGESRRCWVWWQAEGTWYPGWCAYDPADPLKPDIDPNTLWVRVNYDDGQQSECELIGLISFEPPPGLPHDSPAAQAEDSAPDHAGGASQQASSPDPGMVPSHSFPGSLTEDQREAAPPSPRSPSPGAAPSHGFPASLGDDDGQAGSRQPSPPAPSMVPTHSLPDPLPDGDDQGGDLSVPAFLEDSDSQSEDWPGQASDDEYEAKHGDASDGQETATTHDDPFTYMEGGLTSDWPRCRDQLPSRGQVVPILKMVLSRKKIVSRLPPPDQWKQELTQAFLKAADDFAPWFHMILSAEDTPGPLFNQLALELISFPTKVLLAHSDLIADQLPDPPPEHVVSGEFANLDFFNEVYGNEPPGGDGGDEERRPQEEAIHPAMEDIHSSDAEALPRWVKRATTCAFNEEFGKSMREVGSGGMAAHTIRNFKILRPMCPPRKMEVKKREAEVPQIQFTAKQARKFLKKVAHTDKASMGTFGWSGKLIKLFSGGLRVSDDTPSFFELLATFVAKLANGAVPEITAFALTASDMIALNKVSPAEQQARESQGLDPKLRPIMIGVGPLKWALKMVVKSLPVNAAAKEMLDIQLGLTARRGPERFAHHYRERYLMRNAILAVDAQNAFYETEREYIIQAVSERIPSIIVVFMTYYEIKALVMYYIGPDSIHSFLFENGVRMGCSFGSLGFDLCIYPVFRGLQDLDSEAGRPDRLLVRALTDDFPMAIPPPASDSQEDVLAFYNRVFLLFRGAERLLNQHTGGRFNLSKCTLLLHPSIPPPPPEAPTLPFGTTMDGLVLGGAAIGTDQFVHSHLDEQLANFTRTSEKILELPPQVAVRILGDSLIPAYQHHFQLTPPTLTQDHAIQFDHIVDSVMARVLAPVRRPPPVPCSTARQNIATMIMHMPVRRGGLGLKSFRLHSLSAFWSSLACCIAEEDEDLVGEAGVLEQVATDAHGLLHHHLTQYGNFAPSASKILPSDPLTVLKPEFYKQVLSSTLHLQSSLSDIIEKAQEAAVKRAILATRDSNPSVVEDWTSLFSHGASRSACLFGRLTDLSNRYDSAEFVDLTRWLCLMPQLPHMHNAEEHPDLDYSVERCSMTRHAITGPPLTDAQQRLDLHGAHARSNCPSTKAGVAVSHNGLKRMIEAKGTEASMIEKNEPTHVALLDQFNGPDCARLFPDRTSKQSSERSCQLVEEAHRIRELPHGEPRQARQAELDRRVAGLPAAKGARLDVMLKQPPSALGPALWIDVATVHPLAHSNMAKERARTQRAIAEFEEDPAAATPARLRRQPTLQAMVNFKKLKYQALNRAKALHDNAAVRSAVFIPLVVTTLGQVHGLNTVLDIMCATFLRKLKHLGPRADGVEPPTLLGAFRRDVRASVLVQAAKGFAQSLAAAGTPYRRPP